MPRTTRRRPDPALWPLCTIAGGDEGDPMRAACRDLTVTSMPAGHGLPPEREAEHIEAIRGRLGSDGRP